MGSNMDTTKYATTEKTSEEASTGTISSKSIE
jgi:hypothetical protein